MTSSSYYWNKPIAPKRKSLSDTIRAQIDDEGLSLDSWVELQAPSRGSICSSIDAALLVEAQSSQPSSTKDSRHSPKSLQSPNVEFEQLDMVKERLVKDMLPPGKGSDWIWDWSSRPEAIPPKDMKFRHPGTTSLMTTPPNSPAPSLEHLYPWSMRHSKMIRSEFFKVEVIFGLVISNFVTFLLGACIGYWLCQKIEQNNDY